MGVADPVHDAINRVVRDEWPALMATLYRDLGDLDSAQDAAQEAAEIALTRWIDDGIPDRPAAWITTVARRRALDRIRRERTGRGKSELLARLQAPLADGQALDRREQLGDDQLRLFFGCCHPALSVEAQIALTLRSLGGLTTTEIARAFLVPEATMAQRIVRAKRKIADAAIPFRVPDGAELLTRVQVVHHVLYLVFNEGSYASVGPTAVRLDLAAEALRLTRLLTRLLTDDAESLGLLARRDARIDTDGSLVLLAEQDRTRWHQSQILEGVAVLDQAIRLDQRGPYQIQAAINAVHAEAARADATDWLQIVGLYESLHPLRPTPVVALNHAVAVAMAHGPELGMALLDRPALTERLTEYRYYHAARADLLRRMDHPDAVDAYRRALALTEGDVERRFLRARLAELDTG